jgi:hypothetical protein
MNSSQTSLLFASYAELKSWLYEEIGEVSLETLQKYPLPEILKNINQLSHAAANQRLKEVFIEQFLSESDYTQQVAFLSQTTPRETRLKIQSPPTQH